MGKVLRQPEQGVGVSVLGGTPPVPAAIATAMAAPVGAETIEATLQQRGSRYGQFTTGASIMQALKSVMRGTHNWPLLHPDQQEALEMIAHKIGRILNGDPDHHDSWHDIVGYTKLVADRLATGKAQ